MKTSGKIIVTILAVLAVFCIAFLIDNYVLDQGDQLVVPDVGIKAATLDPTFLTQEGQPLLLVFVKGDAKSVQADVAKRVAPTKGGETLSSYDLENLDIKVPADKVNEEDTGELNIWGKSLDVPSDAGQYLVTVTATDQKDASTKFKMFNYIMSVQDEAELKEVPALTSGQASFSDFLQKITDEEWEDAYDYLSPELREEINFDLFQDNYRSLAGAEIVRYNLISKDNQQLRETDEIIVRYESGEENRWRVEFELNVDNPTADWQLISIQKVI